MKTTKLVIEDQVNCRFYDLDPETRRAIVNELSFLLPYARHVPAFKMGRWDGKVSFATVGGGTYINLLDRILPIVDAAGYKIELVDQRNHVDIDLPEIDENYLSDFTWPAKHRLAGEPIILADHQVRAINAYSYADNHQSIQSISTSAGKTIITAALAKLVGESTGKRTLTIVPSKSLVKQTYADFKLVGLDVGMFFGDEKEWGHQHVVATWQSLSVFVKKDRRKQVVVDASFADFIKDMIAVVVDECHSAKAVELRALLDDPRGCAHFPLRWGMTGTVPKEPFEYLAIFGVLGPVVNSITARELQDKQIMSECHVTIMQTDDSDQAFKEYAQAYKYLTTDEVRIQWLAEYVMELQKTGNVLLLYDRYATCDILKEIIPDLYVVNGEMKLDKREAIYGLFSDDTKMICAATYGVAAVGVNIPALHHVVLLEAGKSFTRSIQSVGRGLRRTAIKVYVDIHDICSNNKFSARHLRDRKKYYEEAQYPYTIKKVKYR